MTHAEKKNLIINSARWREVASRHHKDSIILEKERRYIGALYLKGYCIECLLKSILLNQYDPMALLKNERLYDNVNKSFFKGKYGHDLIELFDRVYGQPMRNDRIRANITVFCSVWSVNLRYQTDTSAVQNEKAKGTLRLGDSIRDFLKG